MVPINIPALKPNCSKVRPNLFAKLTIEGILETLSVTKLIIQGPKEAPISPPAAKIANIDAPAKGNFSEEITRVPGHNKVTAIPQVAHAIRESGA